MGCGKTKVWKPDKIVFNKVLKGFPEILESSAKSTNKQVASVPFSYTSKREGEFSWNT